VLVAQTPTPQRGATSTPDGQTVTATGCLKAEKDVPGREPNIAERAGMGEDYILTNAKLSGADAATGGDLAGASALWRNSFKIEGIDDAELRKHLGHRIQVTGRLEIPETLTGSPAKPTVEHLREIHATSVKMIAERCTATE
jgi:hypothetical protein